jgi:hypothetical protein
MIEEGSGTNDPARCSLCSKAESEVWKLFPGPLYHICDECAQSCDRLIAEFKAPLACPRCGSAAQVRRSKRRPWERLMIVLALRPYRCENCQRRFWRPPKKLRVAARNVFIRQTTPEVWPDFSISVRGKDQRGRNRSNVITFRWQSSKSDSSTPKSGVIRNSGSTPNG